MREHVFNYVYVLLYNSNNNKKWADHFDNIKGHFTCYFMCCIKFKTFTSFFPNKNDSR